LKSSLADTKYIQTEERRRDLTNDPKKRKESIETKGGQL
jgi:hypothetical protein